MFTLESYRNNEINYSVPFLNVRFPLFLIDQRERMQNRFNFDQIYIIQNIRTFEKKTNTSIFIIHSLEANEHVW
jgi:hypothetical protein